MSRSHLGLVAVVTIGALSLGGANAYAEEAPSPKDLKSYVCKDVMRMAGEDREIALALLHGYMLGKKNKTQFITEELAETTDNFIEHCLDHPTENALQAFEKAAK